MSQPNLYARVRTFFVQIARETAGAACTRSSLRPRYRVRAERDGKLGQIMSRECEAASSHSVSSPGCALLRTWTGRPSTPRLIGSTTTVSGILDHPHARVTTPRLGCLTS